MENKDNRQEITSSGKTDIKSSIRSYWDSHREDRDFLFKYIRKNQTGRMLFITLSIVLFILISVGAAFLLSSLVKNGLSHVGYYLFIFVYILFILIYWLIYQILFQRMDFRGNTRNAKRLLASPIGKETQIREFIDSQKISSEKKDSTKGKHMVRKLIAVLAAVIIVFTGLYIGYVKFLGPFINYNRGKNSMGKGDHLKAIECFTRSRGYKNTDELLAQELASFMETSKKYDSIVGTYNDYLAVRDPNGDVYYQEYSQIAFPDIAISNAENIEMLSNYIVAARTDGAVSYAQYTYKEGTTAPDVSSWTEIKRLQKVNNSVIGYQNDDTIIYSLSQINKKSLDRLTAGDITGIYDKMGLFGIKEDGTVSVPDASQFSYTEKAQATIDVVKTWKNMAIVKGDVTNFMLGLTKDGYVVYAEGWFPATEGEANVSSWSNIIDIACGEAHSVGLKPDGTVVATGNNSYGQCDVSEWTDVVAVEAGNNFTIGIRKDGSVYITGQKNKQYIPRGFTGIATFEKPQEEIIDDDEYSYYSSSHSYMTSSTTTSSGVSDTNE